MVSKWKCKLKYRSNCPSSDRFGISRSNCEVKIFNTPVNLYYLFIFFVSASPPMFVRRSLSSSQLRSVGSCPGSLVTTSRGRRPRRAAASSPGRSASRSRSPSPSPSARMSPSLSVKKLRRTKTLEASRFFLYNLDKLRFNHNLLNLGALRRKTCQKMWSGSCSDAQGYYQESLLLKKSCK